MKTIFVRETIVYTGPPELYFPIMETGSFFGVNEEGQIKTSLRLGAWYRQIVEAITCEELL